MSNATNWPYDWNKPDTFSDKALTKIVQSLPFYAFDVVNRKDPQEVGMSESLYTGFQFYCKLAKEYFGDTIKKSPSHCRYKLTEIAEEAFRIADDLSKWVENRITRDQSGIYARYLPIDDPCSFTELEKQWDSVVRRFRLSIDSGQEQKNVKAGDEIKSTAETEKITDVKRNRISNFFWKLYEKTLKVIVDAVLERYGPKGNEY